MKKIHAYLLILFSVAAMISCDMKKNKEADPKGFFRIYNEETYTSQYKPLDIEQTSDEGYLVLSSARIDISPFPGIYIMKIDKNGMVQYTKLLSDTYVSAVPNLLRNGNEYYVVCMDRLNLGTYILQLAESGEETETGFIAEALYPLSAELDANGSVIIQHYNKDDRASFVSVSSKTGTVTLSRAFSIGSGDFDVEPVMIDHLTGQGKRLPFQCGRLSGSTYYFNGFYNYTLSLCMFDFNWPDENDPAVLQGYRDERCLSSVSPSGGNTIATSRYAYGDNYIITTATVPTTSGSFAASSNLPGFFIPELVSDAHIELKQMNLNGKDLLLYASDTKNGQIALYAYEKGSHQLIGTKYLGAGNTFQLANMIKTSDESLTVIATTYVAGRFPRIAVFKLDKEDLDW